MNSDFCVAVHALVFLRHKGERLSSEALAENICTNPARVRKVMARLKSAGLVLTREGVVGGYQVDPSVGRASLAQVADALGIRCVEIAWHSGDVHRACQVSSGMAGAMDEIVASLNAACRRELEQIHIEEIERKLLEGKGEKHETV